MFVSYLSNTIFGNSRFKAIPFLSGFCKNAFKKSMIYSSDYLKTNIYYTILYIILKKNYLKNIPITFLKENYSGKLIFF